MFSEKELEQQIENATNLEELAKPLEELLNGPYNVLPNGQLYEIKALVDQVNDFRLVIWPNDYPPPHFHAIGRDFAASFYIEPFARKDGEINPPHFQKVKWFHKRAKGKLLRIWNETRPKV